MKNVIKNKNIESLYLYSVHLSQSMAIDNINLPPHNIEAEKAVIS